MPAVTRELSVIYGSITIGGSSERILDGNPVLRRSYGRTVFECEFTTTLATPSEANFATEIAALEAGATTGLLQPRQRLRVILGAQTLLDLNPASATNTGYNARPSLEKIGSTDDTARTRRYRFSVEVDTPATLDGQAGRFDEEVAVDFTASNGRIVTMRGQYRAQGANDATAQYEAQIAGHQTTVLAAIDGSATWNLLRQRTSRDDADKILTYERIIVELLLAESAAATDDADLFDQRLDVRQGRVAPGDDPTANASRLVNIEVTYSAVVAKTVTDLKGKWDSVIRPWILQHVRDTTSLGALAVVSEDPRFDGGSAQEKRISATMRMVAQGSSAVAEKITTSDFDLDHGMEFVPTHDDEPLAAHAFQGPQTALRTITRRLVTVGPPAGVPDTLAEFVPAAGAQAEALLGDGEHPVRTTMRRFSVLLGLPGETLELFNQEVVQVIRLVRTPSVVATGEAAGGLGGTTTGR